MSRQSGFTLINGLRYATLIGVCLIMMGPVMTAVLGSIRTTGEFLSVPFGLPQTGIRWENYQGILQNPLFWNSLKNSVVITAGVTILNVACACLLAFILSRVEFRGRGLLFNILSIGLLVPLVVAMLPIFIQIRSFNLINSYFGVILPLVAFGLPGSVVILRGFFINIPNELEDASYIDGCSTFGFFRYILLPLARPAITAVAVLQVIAGWNDYILPLLVLNDEKLWPLTLGIQQFQGQYGADWARIMAYVTLLIIPAVIFYLFAEKYIVTGLTGGELKG
ncbi:MAG: carbohydrate ABC transporter permease [candidate division KSB1 bacterium]|nr:carbohydrate ABC transporter permease [candidate division KSB1 bacterium]